MARLGSTELVTELRRQNLYTRERKKKGDAFSFIVRKGEGEDLYCTRKSWKSPELDQATVVHCTDRRKARYRAGPVRALTGGERYKQQHKSIHHTGREGGRDYYAVQLVRGGAGHTWYTPRDLDMLVVSHTRGDGENEVLLGYWEIGSGLLLEKGHLAPASEAGTQLDRGANQIKLFIDGNDWSVPCYTKVGPGAGGTKRRRTRKSQAPSQAPFG